MTDDDFFRKLVEMQLISNEEYPTCAWSMNNLFEEENIVWVNLDGSLTVNWVKIKEEATRQIKPMEVWYNDRITIAHLKAFQRKALATVFLAAKDNFKTVEIEASNDINHDIIKGWTEKKEARATFTS